MNDRFKFRCWDKENNKMYKVHSLHIGTNKVIVTSLYGNASIKLNENKILMQCTGLKDKNGKLIYEGDVVKQNKTIYCVTWEEGSYGFCDIRTKITYTVEYVMSKKQEVLGNIYENPDLLKECEDE